MPSSQELSHGAERLHAHLLTRHYSHGLLHGPDAGVRYNLRLWRFFKAGLTFVPWHDDYVFMQSQGYWILSNWMLHEATGDPKYRTLALESAEATLRLQQAGGYWLYPLPERKHLVATVEGNWGATGLLATHAREPREEFLQAAVRWYDYLVGNIGFQPHRRGEAINYFNEPRGKIPNNSVEAVWVFLRLWKATGDARFAEHVDALLDFLTNTQLSSGEFPYIVDGPYEKGRIHYLCFQYNAFQFLKLAWAEALRPDPRIRRLLEALTSFLAQGISKTGASAADCSHAQPETDYFTAVLAAALWEASKSEVRGPKSEVQPPPSPLLSKEGSPKGGVATCDFGPRTSDLGPLRALSEQCYARLLQRQRRDGSFAYTTGDYGVLRDGRSYPRPQVMTLFHLLYPTCGNGFERTML